MARLLLWLALGGLFAGRLVVPTSAFSNSPPGWAWTLNVPGARGHAVATDPSGNVYITGGFGGTVAFGTTNLTAGSRWSELFVAKVDPSGQFVWAAQAIGSRDAYVFGQAIAVDSSGNVYVGGSLYEEADFGPTNLNSGYFTWSDAFLAKYDSTGRCQWAWQGNSRDDPWAYCSAVAVDSNDDVIISGHYKPGIFCDEPGGCLNNWHDAFVAKFSGAGAVQWYRDLGGGTWNEANALALDEADNVYMTGFFSRESGFGTSRGVSDLYVAKYDSGGALQWVRQAGAINDGNDDDDSYDEGLGVVVDRLGAVYVTGSFAGGEVTFGETNLTGGTRDFFLAKYNAAGELNWVRKGYGSLGTGIAIDGAGEVYTTVSPPFIHKYDAAGNVQWTKDIGPGQGLTEAAIAIAPDGSKYIATDNVFLRKLDSAGTGPRLSITTSAESVTLSWQLAAVDYGPQVANDLAAPDWRPVSGTDGTNGLSRTLTLSPPNQNQFYRLQKNN